jgi:hypothetical protein
LLIDVEAATAGLIGHWLAGDGWLVGTEATRKVSAAAPVALVVLEIAYPRHCTRQRIDALAAAWPGVPLLVLSPTFFAEVPPQGEVARQMGATAVLATPLTRERLVTTVRGLAAS